jgi:hypothetical protein
MGHMHAMEFRGLCGKERGLDLHLTGNFYPPFNPDHKKAIMEGFKKYWNHEITIEELPEAIFARDIDVIYHYFDCYLNEEDSPYEEEFWEDY